MAIRIARGGTARTYRYHPHDVILLGDGRQVREVWVNGARRYPETPDSDIELELRFADSPHHFSKSDVAPRERIRLDREQYDRFLGVDEGEWIYSTASVHTYDPPTRAWGITTRANTHTSTAFPEHFGSDGSTVRFAFRLARDNEGGVSAGAYYLGDWPEYRNPGNYDEDFYYRPSGTVHTDMYFLGNGVTECDIRAFDGWHREENEEILFRTVLNSRRSYEFYVFGGPDWAPSAAAEPRLIAEYRDGELTVHDGYVHEAHVSAAADVADLARAAGIAAWPSHGSH